MHSTHMNCCEANLGTASTGSTVINSDANSTTNTAKLDKEATVIGKAKATGPILFAFEGKDAILGADWENYKASTLARMKADDKLEIKGYYSSEEKSPKGFNNMGEARAEEARLALGLDNERVILKGVLSNSIVDKNNRFEGVDVSVISGKPKSVEETNDGKIRIRFPYNSTNKLSDSEVEDYLDKVAERVKKSGEKVSLVGHTDSKGKDSYNMTLGKKRADIIKRYLTSKGVKSSQITTSSKGESSPIASNSSEAGRAENRRTELQIIK